MKTIVRFGLMGATALLLGLWVLSCSDDFTGSGTDASANTSTGDGDTAQPNGTDSGAADADVDGDADMSGDNDGDGWNLPFDCNDNSSAINPDAAEVPDNNVDDDCDGTTDEVELVDTSSDSGQVCGQANVDFTAQIPTVMLLIDQSGSMSADFPNSGDPSRWQVAKNALIDPQNGIVKQLEDQVRFGISLYTSNGGGTVPDQCPLLTTVSPAMNNYQSIYDLFWPAPLGSDTPTGEAIAATSATLQAINEPGPKVIVLATDGDPDTCAVPNPQTQEAKDFTEAKVKEAFDAGVFTFVISVGSQTTESHMQNVAAAGQGKDPAISAQLWYEANDTAALTDAFNTIINGVRSCVFDLSGEIVAGKESSCNVVINSGGTDQKVPFNDPDGWKVNSATQIQLVGQSCQDIQTGNVNASVSCPCDAFIGID